MSVRLGIGSRSAQKKGALMRAPRDRAEVTTPRAGGL
jgi:hypothetical protein